MVGAGCASAEPNTAYRIGGLVAAIARPVPSSFSAAERNSSALPRYERACDADTARVRIGLGTSAASQVFDGQALKQHSVSNDVVPHRRFGTQLAGHVAFGDLEHLDRVAGETAGPSPELLDGADPSLIVGMLRTDEHDVEIAVLVGLPPSERAKHDRAHRSRIDPGGEMDELLQRRLTRLTECADGMGTDVLVDERVQRRGRCLPPLHEALVDEQRKDTGRLRRAHPCQPCDRPEVELRSRLRKDGKDSPLHAWDDGFHGTTKVHDDTLTCHHSNTKQMFLI